MQTNREVVPRYLELFRNLCRRLAIEIDAFDEFRVVPSETWEETMKAGTCGIPYLIQWWLLKSARNGRFLQEGLMTTNLGFLCTIMVSYHMAKDAIEPGQHAFLIVQ